MENSLANKKPWLVAEWSERNGIGMVTKKRHIIAGGCQRALHQKCLVEVQYLRT